MISGSLHTLTLTGSCLDKNMLMTNSGPTAALFFEYDGTMSLIMNNEIDEEDSVSILVMSEYLHYALTKTEWMDEFIKSTIDKVEVHDKSVKRSHLSVIEGGKSSSIEND
jgi:hypothetical protein